MRNFKFNTLFAAFFFSSCCQTPPPNTSIDAIQTDSKGGLTNQWNFGLMDPSKKVNRDEIDAILNPPQK